MVDIIGGLAAASQAVGLVKELKEIDRGVDEASFKLKIAELVDTLADTKIALSDAKVKLSEKDQEIAKLTQKLSAATSGEQCPKCEGGKLKFSEKIPVTRLRLDQFGVEKWKYSCSNKTCDFETTKIHDPAGMVSKTAAGKI